MKARPLALTADHASLKASEESELMLYHNVISHRIGLRLDKCKAFLDCQMLHRKKLLHHHHAPMPDSITFVTFQGGNKSMTSHSYSNPVIL